MIGPGNEYGSKDRKSNWRKFVVKLFARVLGKLIWARLKRDFI